ncbi:MAG: hypothetical protein OEZ39_01535 [Gammaproteobacteria bacterium]|nr:hypothetical protein [Gammaproteobacteria bacterium]MDH5650535.1 hypothetical protein [Gammaproteobacteria bacterium]
MLIKRHEKETLLQLIDTFYKAAGEPGWSGNINNEIAHVFTHMLIEAQRCLSDYTWGLHIGMEPITVQWLIHQIEPRTIERMGQLNENKSCLEFIIEKWDQELRIASAGDVDEDELDEFSF